MEAAKEMADDMNRARESQPSHHYFRAYRLRDS